MFRFFLLLLIPNLCFADASFWENSVDWLKESVEEQAIVTLDKQKFQFSGFRDRQAKLSISKPIGEYFSFNTSLEIKRQSSKSGVCQLKLSSYSYEFMPRVHFAKDVLIGIGARKFVAGELQFGPDQYVKLESGHEWVLSALLSEFGAAKSLELRLSAMTLYADEFSPLKQQKRFTDSAIKLVYRSHF
ncbi:hypothetical protein QX776_05230 [Alteromonadaceae bacterium BrNp21-10]|nr:hypothetical protein [Alteromonadaceae bacterium BrNp21-10]